LVAIDPLAHFAVIRLPRDHNSRTVTCQPIEEA